MDGLYLDWRDVVGERYKARLADFVTAECEVEQIGVAEQNDDEAVLIAEFVSEQTLDLGDDGAANDHHDKNAGALTGELAEAL